MSTELDAPTVEAPDGDLVVPFRTTSCVCASAIRLSSSAAFDVLRRDEAEPADERDCRDGGHAEGRDDLRCQLVLHQPFPPAVRTLATIVNCIAFLPATSARCIDWSDTSDSAGMSASRSRTRATASRESAFPVTVNVVPVGAEAPPDGLSPFVVTTALVAFPVVAGATRRTRRQLHGVEPDALRHHARELVEQAVPVGTPGRRGRERGEVRLRLRGDCRRDGGGRLLLRDLRLEPLERRAPVAHVGASLHEPEREEHCDQDEDGACGGRDPVRRPQTALGRGLPLLDARSRKQVDAAHLGLDPESDCHCKRRQVVTRVDRVGDLHAGERVGAAGHARASGARAPRRGREVSSYRR